MKYYVITSQHGLICKSTLWKIKPTSCFNAQQVTVFCMAYNVSQKNKSAFIPAWCTQMQMALWGLDLIIGTLVLHWCAAY